MPAPSPSIKALRRAFPDVDAPALKRILTARRSELEDTPAGRARVAECYHPPSLTDLRLTVLGDAMGMHDVESFETTKGRCWYLNAGESYAPTICWFRGRYIIADWGGIVERHGIIVSNA